MPRPQSPMREGSRWTVLLGLCLVILGVLWANQSVRIAITSGPQDVLRRWRVSQYILRGRNPYEVALQVLQQEIGPIGQTKLSKRRTFHIPQPATNASSLGVISSVGAPEAVYPPPAQFAISYTLGLLPERAVLAAWAALNIIFIVSYGAIATRVICGTFVGRRFDLVLGGLLVFSPVQQTIISSQFSVAMAVFLTVAVYVMDRHPLISGVLFSLALIKPSMALPFLILPLIRRRWTVLAIVALTQLTATAVISAVVSEQPWTLTSQWLGVTQYFTQGPYSIQTVLNRLQLENTLLGFSMIAGFCGLTLLWCWRHRNGRQDDLFDFVCFASVLWAYHGPYDLIILFVPVFRMFYSSGSQISLVPTTRWRPLLGVVIFAIIGLGTWSPMYVGADLFPQITRWACRAVLIGSFLLLGFRLVRSHNVSLAMVSPCH